MRKKITVILSIILSVSILSGGIYFYKDSVKKREANLQRYYLCELGDFVGDDVKEIVYEGFVLPYHSDKFSEEEVAGIMKGCIKQGVRNQYEMRCCAVNQMYPQGMENAVKNIFSH